MGYTVEDFRFFRAHAGYVVGRRYDGALRMAKAEAEAKERGITFVWEWDDDGDLGDHECWCTDAENGIEHDHETLWCAAQDADGNVIGSLGSIIDPTPEYRRVIQAELALEALG